MTMILGEPRRALDAALAAVALRCEDDDTVRAWPRRWRAPRVSHSESVFYGSFVWLATQGARPPKTAVAGPGSGPRARRRVRASGR
jgi:hypothetical protein